MAKCPDCGSNSIFHRPGSLGCITNQMPEGERKQQKALASEGFKKIATFIGVAVFLIWLVPYNCRTGELWMVITFLPFALGWLMGWWHGLGEGEERGRIAAVRDHLARRETNQTKKGL